jgi:hypothetical protein
VPVILLFGRRWISAGVRTKPPPKPVADLEPMIVMDSRW